MITYRFFAALLGIALGGGGCAKKDDTGKASDNSGENDGGDDDFKVAQAVPVALLGPELLASVNQGLSSGMASGDYGDLATAHRARADAAADPTFPVASSIIAAPAKAASEMKTLLTGVQNLFAQAFGPAGAFHQQEVQLRKDSRSRLFKLTGDGPEFVELRANPAGSMYQFGADFYTRDSGGTMVASTSVEFSPHPTVVGAALVRFAQVQAAKDEGARQFIRGSYDSSVVKIAVEFGTEPTSELVPAKTVIAYDHDAVGQVTTVQGAYIWNRPNAEAVDLIPEYYNVLDRTIEAFRARAKDGADQAVVQETAFLSPTVMAQAGFVADAGIFAADPYPPMMARFLRRLVRDPAVDSSCSTAGDAFRSAFSGQTPPDSVANINADLCQTNTAVSDADVDKLIADTCDRNVAISVPVHLGTSGGQSPYNLCTGYQETRILTNPQTFNVSAGGRTLVLPPAVPSASQTQLATELRGVPLLDLSQLKFLTWDEPASRPDADFAAAEALP